MGQTKKIELKIIKTFIGTIIQHNKMSVSILANFWLKSKNQTMELPIKKLDGVLVKMRIQIDWEDICKSKNSNMVLVIDSVFKHDMNGEPDNISFFNHFSSGIIVYKDIKEWNIEMMEESLLAIQTLIGKLKYDKIDNRFVSEENNLKAKYDFWSKNSNTEMEGEICCVCHEMTTSTTKCNHPLCLQCWSQMPKIQAPQERFMSDMVGHNCPICREFMLLL